MTNDETNPSTYSMPADAVHAAIDGLRAESEALLSNQPGPEGRAATAKRLAEMSDALLDAIPVIPTDSTPSVPVADASVTPDASSNPGNPGGPNAPKGTDAK